MTDFLSTSGGQQFRTQLIDGMRGVSNELSRSNSLKASELRLKEQELQLRERELEFKKREMSLKERELNGNFPIPSLLDDKDSLLLVTAPYDGYIHQSWLIEGRVVSFEHIPENYPSGGLMVSQSIEEYIEAIKEVSWINDKEYIRKNRLEQYGFPFNQDEEELSA